MPAYPRTLSYASYFWDRGLDQLDFEKELRSTIAFANMFRNDADVRIPGVYPHLCKEGVLVLEFIEGLRRLDARTVSDADFAKAVTSAVRALYRMIFHAGVFHCDLHGGNLLLDRVSRLHYCPS